ncbi:MAG TPA: restriction endonuclease, partial [Candidatus Hydrogenedentes bacterium]|nr:restriction endonuclease [Candidatus Hydrogenedentota bacterium]
VIYGSKSTHTLLSYFDVDLNIITLLEGERKVDKPIHKQEYFKKMNDEVLKKAVKNLKNLLHEFI